MALKGFLKKKIVAFESIDFTKEIEKELKDKNEFVALVLLHAYTENYLKDIIFYLNKSNKKATIKPQIYSEISKVKFPTLCLIYLNLEIIDEDLYEKLIELNESRNYIVHNLISLNIDDEKSRELLRKEIENGKKACGKLYSIYQKKLEECSTVI
ncbi:Uncharacterised protein [uncultured archaeon]|nr:Uncharacterised protein [uncultured archaeon]